MTFVHSAVALGCVILIAIGQMMFKSIGLMLADGFEGRGARIVATLVAVLAIYGAATLAWIWVLKHMPLSKAYPYMALSFVLVPAAAALLFGERLSGQYVVGVLLIVAGLVLTTR